MNEIKIEVWGDFACFSRPESKVERLTYPVITPSAARGILSAVYSKPVEFYWQIRQIEVLKPIRYATFKRNEVINSKISKKNMEILKDGWQIFVDETSYGIINLDQSETITLGQNIDHISNTLVKRIYHLENKEHNVKIVNLMDSTIEIDHIGYGSAE